MKTESQLKIQNSAELPFLRQFLQLLSTIVAVVIGGSSGFWLTARIEGMTSPALSAFISLSVCFLLIFVFVKVSDLWLMVTKTSVDDQLYLQKLGCIQSVDS